MNILVINSGSSSIKFQLVKMPEEEVICRGVADRIGTEDATLTYSYGQNKFYEQLPIPSHEAGLERIVRTLLDSETKSGHDIGDIEVVGHRVVHGGSEFSGTVIVDESVKKQIRKYIPMAPLHNPHNLLGIELAEKLIPDSRQMAVFDTAFHQTMPKTSHKYAIPETLYEDRGIRAYGFHGTSHSYVSKKAMEFAGSPADKIISMHLGNGCSITAVKNGKSIDHSLGFAPSNGLIMGTRSGDIDHAIIFYLHRELGYELNDIQALLDKESGMLGLTGFSDLREIEAAAQQGDLKCQMALEMNAYRIKKYIGAYAAAMNGLDILIFTAGIGENSRALRSLICKDLEFLGIELSSEKNNADSSEIRSIDTGDMPVKILVVPTDEEIEIARQAYLTIRNS
ncbi:MAG: acetate kinase [Flavobacteriaceae bacterium]